MHTLTPDSYHAAQRFFSRPEQDDSFVECANRELKLITVCLPDALIVTAHVIKQVEMRHLGICIIFSNTERPWISNNDTALLHQITDQLITLFHTHD